MHYFWRFQVNQKDRYRKIHNLCSPTRKDILQQWWNLDMQFLKSQNCYKLNKDRRARIATGHFSNSDDLKLPQNITSFQFLFQFFFLHYWIFKVVAIIFNKQISKDYLHHLIKINTQKNNSVSGTGVYGARFWSKLLLIGW